MMKNRRSAYFHKPFREKATFIMPGFDDLELFLEYICKIDLAYLYIE